LWLQDLETNELDVLPQPNIDAVQVMTHHAAKGLEWPVVVLVDLAGDVKNSIWDAVRAESTGAFDVGSPLKDRALRYWPWPYGAQQKVDVADDVEASAKGQSITTAAVEEHKRLLYVSTTRARDLLVIARAKKKPDGEWMQTVGLAQRLAGKGEEPIVLCNGTAVPITRRDLTPACFDLPHVQGTGELCWFDAPATRTERPPLTVSPSMLAAAGGTVAETATIGRRIPVVAGFEPTVLGEAVHACLAAQLAAPKSPLEEQDVAAVLQRMAVGGAVSPADLLAQIGAVQAWLQQKWPGATVWVEAPVARTLDNGQQLNGRIDLLLRVSDGWILLDYKSGAQGSEQWASLARSYGGQLAAYREAIEAVTEVPVLESWLVLPIAGAAVRVDADRIAPEVGV
jgi:ATP-dependent exoDNAse (exonuclease V) beta subunit